MNAAAVFIRTVLAIAGPVSSLTWLFLWRYHLSLLARRWCGLIGDDIINALTPEWVENTYGSLYRLIFDQGLNWAAIGRLYPISIAVTYTVWNYAYYDPAYAKVISLIGYVVCLGVTADFIRRFTTSARVALFFILITTLCVQFRVWYDAILCFPLLVPLTLTLVMLQASLLYSYLTFGPQWYLYLALAVFAVGLLTYELAIVALPIDLSILWVAHTSRKQKLSIVATIAGLFLAYLLLQRRFACRGPSSMKARPSASTRPNSYARWQ